LFGRNSVYNGWNRFVRHSKQMAKTAVKLIVAAMLALLAMQAPMPPVRVVAAFEIIWLAQTEVRQRAPRNIQRAARTTRNRHEPAAYASFAGTEPDVVLVYQLPPPPRFSFAS
jgi:hypothetical protein